MPFYNVRSAWLALFRGRIGMIDMVRSIAMVIAWNQIQEGL